MMTTMTVGILGTKQHDTKTQPKDKTPGKTEGKSVPGGCGGIHTTTKDKVRVIKVVFKIVTRALQRSGHQSESTKQG